jgi:hypothetical protein
MTSTAIVDSGPLIAAANRSDRFEFSSREETYRPIIRRPKRRGGVFRAR